MRQRLVTELKEVIDLLFDLKTDLIYSFNKFKRHSKSQNWFNEIKAQATNTNVSALEMPTRSIKW